ncbi:hypothetical protein BASA61_005039 [Batrachochytrium salamandrivorans]|nr:hypothetical protein BASA62_008683 [Batrachochytrium salamandrivorans]KAH6591185.1 hypothetical protein BASA61_005039 [Batrachochytrium salamandrivorans]KAH9274969.1 hypothetical protein BASA83_002681 [Batrachochytrium salamandrivorans]
MHDGHHNTPGHNCAPAQGSAVDYAQSLDELAFERSLHHAANSNNLARLTRLLAAAPATNGKSICNICDLAGYAPLHYAARQGHVEACRLLIQGGADLNATTPELRSTALHRAALGGHADVVSLLLKAGACCTEVDANDRTPYAIATAKGYDQVADLLK